MYHGVTFWPYNKLKIISTPGRVKNPFVPLPQLPGMHIRALLLSFDAFDGLSERARGLFPSAALIVFLFIAITTRLCLIIYNFFFLCGSIQFEVTKYFEVVIWLEDIFFRRGTCIIVKNEWKRSLCNKTRR